MQVNRLARAAVAVVGATAALAAAAGPASADPSPVTDYRMLAGVGSDTIQDVMNGLGDTITIGGAKVIASWDARGTDTIKTKATGCELARPNGSTAGRNALRESQTPGSATEGCIDFGRSSSGPVSGGSNGSWVRFGIDAVSYAINSSSDLPDNLTTVQLERIYKCLDTDILGTPVTPLLIQSGSGTRSFWLGRMGITEAEIANGDYPCLEDLGDTVQEHDGRVLAGHNDYLLPFSIAQFIAQGNALPGVEDRRGPALLGSVNGVAPTSGGVLNTNFPYRRDVYNVVPTADVTDPTIAATFIGPSSLVCQNSAVIQTYGFGFDASTCGTSSTGLL